jgi:hypothetical protein
MRTGDAGASYEIHLAATVINVYKNLFFFIFFSRSIILCTFVDIYTFSTQKKNNIYVKDTFSERLTVQIH